MWRPVDVDSTGISKVGRTYKCLRKNDKNLYLPGNIILSLAGKYDKVSITCIHSEAWGCLSLHARKRPLLHFCNVYGRWKTTHLLKWGHCILDKLVCFFWYYSAKSLQWERWSRTCSTVYSWSHGTVYPYLRDYKMAVMKSNKWVAMLW